MKTAVVVDYGMCNLFSVAQAVKAAAVGLAFDVQISANPDVVRTADRIILPGQGAMPDCMRELRESGLQESVLHAAHNKPLFGVCVGMQMLLDRSHEGNTPSLGLISGEVMKFDLNHLQQSDGSRYKVPQMGWNRVSQTKGQTSQPHALWQGIDDHSYFYFVHSYYAKPTNLAHCAGETEYGDVFASSIARDNIFATQFHPEKSAAQGLRLYRNFLTWNP